MFTKQGGVRTIFSKHNPLPAVSDPAPPRPPQLPAQEHQVGGVTAGWPVTRDIASSSTELA